LKLEVKLMETFSAFWQGLQPLNQWLFIAAAFFGVLLLWQIVMAFIGLGAGAELDAHVESTAHHDSPGDADSSVVAFKLLSITSIVAFFTLFTWGGALYMSKGVPPTLALGYGVLWGVGAMFLVSLLLYGMRRMTETGNIRISTAVGSSGNVYLDIPAGGDGEIRVLCSGVVTHLKARSSDGAAIKAGTSVKVIKVTGANSVEVQVDNSSSKGKE
jgi:membrane protein implicated in regulation of membrane protease activity